MVVKIDICYAFTDIWGKMKIADLEKTLVSPSDWVDVDLFLIDGTS